MQLQLEARFTVGQVKALDGNQSSRSRSLFAIWTETEPQLRTYLYAFTDALGLMDNFTVTDAVTRFAFRTGGSPITLESVGVGEYK